MIRIHWDDAPLDVQRLVVRRDLPPRYLSAVRRLALRHGLFVVTPAARPQPGDFWLGCAPDGGWGDADPRAVGRAGLFDLEAGLDALEADELEPVLVG